MNSASSHSYEGSAQHFDVAVIGGGQAGLAIGHFLRQEGCRFVILERASELAPAWRERWDSLTLFTPRRYSALSGVAFPGDPDEYPTRDEVIAYLERYAETFQLPIELNSEAKKLELGEDGRFRLELEDRAITADQVVVATGPFQSPFVPKLAERLAPEVFQVHATGYRRADEVPPGNVLVIGGGNTGYQIAKELSATHKVALSIGSRQNTLAATPARTRPLLVAGEGPNSRQVSRNASRATPEHEGDADRLEPTRAQAALWGRAETARG